MVASVQDVLWIVSLQPVESLQVSYETIRLLECQLATSSVSVFLGMFGSICPVVVGVTNILIAEPTSPFLRVLFCAVKQGFDPW
jgi:hypothetical protein